MSARPNKNAPLIEGPKKVCPKKVFRADEIGRLPVVVFFFRERCLEFRLSPKFLPVPLLALVLFFSSPLSPVERGGKEDRKERGRERKEQQQGLSTAPRKESFLSLLPSAGGGGGGGALSTVAVLQALSERWGGRLTSDKHSIPPPPPPPVHTPQPPPAEQAHTKRDTT